LQKEQGGNAAVAVEKTAMANRPSVG